jgi:flagellar motor switch protein FliN
MSRRLAALLAGEMAARLAAAPRHEVTLDPSEPETGPGLRLSFKIAGPMTGTALVWFPTSTGANAARAAGGPERPVSPDDVSRVLREAAGQALVRVAETPEFATLEITMSGVTPASAPHGATHSAFAFADGSVGFVAASAMLVTTEAPAANGNLELVLDVELPLVVRFGRTVMSLKALSGLGPGSIVDMGRSPDDPVELLVSDKVVAYGEVVIVDGNYGLRITDLVSRSDRLRAVEFR